MNEIKHIVGRIVKRHFLPSFGDLAFIFVALILVSQYGWFNILGDGDTHIHIQAGQYMLNSGQILHHDPFSFGMEGHPWFAHGWLSEVLMAAVFKVFGLDGVSLLYIAVLGLSLLLLVRYILGRYGMLAALVIFFLFILSSVHWLARPHIWTYLGVVLFVDWLDRLAHDERIPVWSFALVMLFWVNLHGGYMLGLVLIGMNFIGTCIFWVRTRSASALTMLKKLFLILMLCIAASLLNPYGIEIWLNSARVSGDGSATTSWQEWMTPNFRENPVLLFDFMAVVALYLLSSIRVSSQEWMRFMGFGVLALQAVRNLPIFFMANATGIGRRMRQLSGERWFPQGLKERLDDYEEIERASIPGIWAAAVFVVIIGLCFTGQYHFALPEKSYPRKALEYLRQENLPGRGFNSDEIGDYMIGELWPQYHVFVDGRCDFYAGKRLKDYLIIDDLKPTWEAALEENGIGWAIVYAKQRLAVALKTHPDWRLIYSDNVAEIFVKNEPAYKKWIDQNPTSRTLV
jgi:hypothetical protein